MDVRNYWQSHLINSFQIKSVLDFQAVLVLHPLGFVLKLEQTDQAIFENQVFSAVVNAQYLQIFDYSLYHIGFLPLVFDFRKLKTV